MGVTLTSALCEIYAHLRTHLSHLFDKHEHLEKQMMWKEALKADRSEAVQNTTRSLASCKTHGLDFAFQHFMLDVLGI